MSSNKKTPVCTLKVKDLRKIAGGIGGRMAVSLTQAQIDALAKETAQHDQEYSNWLAKQK